MAWAEKAAVITCPAFRHYFSLAKRTKAHPRFEPSQCGRAPTHRSVRYWC